MLPYNLFFWDVLTMYLHFYFYFLYRVMKEFEMYMLKAIFLNDGLKY